MNHAIPTLILARTGISSEVKPPHVKRQEHISLSVDLNRVLLFDTSPQGMLLNTGEV